MAAAKRKAAGEEAAGLPFAHNNSNNNSPPKRGKGRWTKEEHEGFLVGLTEHGRDWSALAIFSVPSRTVTQIRTHAQKYFRKTDQGLPFPEASYSNARIEQPNASSESEPTAAATPSSGCNGNESGDTAAFHSYRSHPAAQQHEAWSGSPTRGRHRTSALPDHHALVRQARATRGQPPPDDGLAGGRELPSMDAWCAAEGKSWSEMGVWDDAIQLMFLSEETFGLL